MYLVCRGGSEHKTGKSTEIVIHHYAVLKADAVTNINVLKIFMLHLQILLTILILLFIINNQPLT